MPYGFVVAVRHAAATIRLITISTGIKSAILSSLHIIVWKIPFPTADIIPVGPFQLSTQPTNGSLTLDKTKSNQTIM